MTGIIISKDEVFANPFFGTNRLTPLASFGSDLSFGKKGIGMDIDPQEARKAVERISPRLGHDFAYLPVYPAGRKDVCAIRYSSDDGEGYGFDTIYLLWRDSAGKLKFARLARSEDPDYYSHIAGIKEENEEIIVKINSGKSRKGMVTVFRKNKSELNLA